MGFCCLAVYWDITAYIKRRVGRSNGACGGVMV